MLRILIKRAPVTAEQSLRALRERGIMTNRYAEMYISHPRFSAGGPGEMTAAVASLEELGLEGGASLDELFRHIQGTRFAPCPPDAGLFLRLAWTDQPQSRNSVLAGTHGSPDQAVTVLSDMPERDDAFPRGFACARWTAFFGFGAACTILHTAFRAARFLRLKCAGHERPVPFIVALL